MSNNSFSKSASKVNQVEPETENVSSLSNDLQKKAILIVCRTFHKMIMNKSLTDTKSKIFSSLLNKTIEDIVPDFVVHLWRNDPVAFSSLASSSVVCSSLQQQPPLA